jgi:signal transduction histidine kinase
MASREPRPYCDARMTSTAVPDRPPPSLPRWQRSLLPSMLGADHADRGQAGASRLPRSLRDWLVDIVFFLWAAGLGIGIGWSDAHHVGTLLTAVDAVLGAGGVLALWFRRRHPLAIGAAIIVASIVSGAVGGAAVVALFTVAVYCPPRRTLELFVVSLAASAMQPALYQDGRHGYDVAGLVVGVLASVGAVAFGAFVRARRDLVLSLQERNRRLQDEQQRRVAEAQRAERNRIAREMHDVLAHRISLLSVHAGALEFNPAASPQEIARAARVIRESARAAQEELRDVIGVLRAEPVDGAVEPPQPTLDDLERLVEESRRAGMEVRLAIALAPRALPPTLGRTVYRLVQEALTNARKHAPGQLVSIVVAGGARAGLRVSVTNQPPVGRAGAGPAPAAGHVGSGTGLVGIEERVALAGGELEREPLPGGGFRLCATLPWREAAR